MNAVEKAARRICQRLHEAGFQALLAGGCVRDLLLGRSPKDYDIATNAQHQEVKQLFEQTINVGASFGVTIVTLPEGHFEVATFRRDGNYGDGRHPDEVTFTNAQEDAKRRDFTINALFLDPRNDTIIDYVGGKMDLEAGVIRAVGDAQKRFQEDYLRMLRCIRFAARLGFEIDPATWIALGASAPMIQQISVERICQELQIMLCDGAARRALELLDESGLLSLILPEVAQLKGVEQPPGFHPEGDVFQHTLLLLEHLEAGCSPTLAWSALFHDIGKPPTQTFEDRIRFNYHDQVGARMATAIGQRYRFSKQEIERIHWLVENHMRLIYVPKMRESKRKRLLREPGFSELLALGRLDALASHGDLSTLEWIEDYQATLSKEEATPPPLLTGHDLIDLGYAPGALFREILHEVETQQLEHRLTTSEEARDFVLKQWPVAKPKTNEQDYSPPINTDKH